jgi:hypothetical protein
VRGCWWQARRGCGCWWPVLGPLLWRGVAGAHRWLSASPWGASRRSTLLPAWCGAPPPQAGCACGADPPWWVWGVLALDHRGALQPSLAAGFAHPSSGCAHCAFSGGSSCPGALMISSTLGSEWGRRKPRVYLRTDDSDALARRLPSRRRHLFFHFFPLRYAFQAKALTSWSDDDGTSGIAPSFEMLFWKLLVADGIVAELRSSFIWFW